MIESEIKDRPAVAHVLLRGVLALHYNAPFCLWRSRDLVVGCSEGDIMAVAYAVLKMHRLHEFAMWCTCSLKKGGIT